MKKSAVLISAMCALVVAQSALFAQTQGEDTPIISGNTNPALKAPITLNAREASLSEVLRVLADRSGMNFVVGEGVTREKISIILNNTPLDEAINLLVRASGLSYEIIGNSILIAEPDKLKEEVGLSSYVVELKYVRAEEAAASLVDLAKNIKIDKGGNKLICYTSPRTILEIERIVKVIDQPHILVLLETRLIEVNMKKVGNYGLDWEALSGNFGANIAASSRPTSSSLSFDGNTRAALDLMVRNEDARMLMNSKLTTTNNREASLHIGDVIIFETQTVYASVGGNANRQIERENVGIMVSMTPHINDKNQITLTIAPEVSNVTGWYEDNIPRIKTRKTNTTVRVEDGQAVLLAGLLSESKVETVKKLPILGSIPILGLLFQHKSVDNEKSNLIIEIVPRIIKNPADITRIMRAQREELKAETKSEPRSKNKRTAAEPVEVEIDVEVDEVAEETPSAQAAPAVQTQATPSAQPQPAVQNAPAPAAAE